MLAPNGENWPKTKVWFSRKKPIGLGLQIISIILVSIRDDIDEGGGDWILYTQIDRISQH